MSDGNKLLGMLAVSVYTFFQKTVVNRKAFCMTVRYVAGHLIMTWLIFL